MKTLRTFRLAGITGDFADCQGLRIVDTKVLRLTIKGRDDQDLGTWTDTKAQWRDFAETILRMCEDVPARPYEEIVQTSGIGLAGGPAIEPREPPDLQPWPPMQPNQQTMKEPSSHEIQVNSQSPQAAIDINLAQAAASIAKVRGYDVGILILAKRGAMVPWTEIRFGRSPDLQPLELQSIMRGIDARMLAGLRPPVVEEHADGESRGSGKGATSSLEAHRNDPSSR